MCHIKTGLKIARVSLHTYAFPLSIWITTTGSDADGWRKHLRAPYAPVSLCWIYCRMSTNWPFKFLQGIIPGHSSPFTTSFMHLIFHTKTVWNSMNGTWMWLDKRRIRLNDIERYTNELVHSTGTTQIYIYQTTRIISQNELGGNTHKVGGFECGGYLNVSQTPQSQLGRNSVPVHMSSGNTKPLHCIKSCANLTVGQLVKPSPQVRKVLIIF